MPTVPHIQKLEIFFAKSRKPLQKWLLLMYLWVRGYEEAEVAHDTAVCINFIGGFVRCAQRNSRKHQYCWEGLVLFVAESHKPKGLPNSKCGTSSSLHAYDDLLHRTIVVEAQKIHTGYSEWLTRQHIGHCSCSTRPFCYNTAANNTAV